MLCLFVFFPKYIFYTSIYIDIDIYIYVYIRWFKFFQVRTQKQESMSVSYTPFNNDSELSFVIVVVVSLRELRRLMGSWVNDWWAQWVSYVTLLNQSSISLFQSLHHHLPCWSLHRRSSDHTTPTTFILWAMVHLWCASRRSGQEA